MLDFNKYILETSQRLGPLVQPRMGVSMMEEMREGLIRTAGANDATVCTITLDSFTRVCDFSSASRAIEKKSKLNGFPLVSHDTEVVKGLVEFVKQRLKKPLQVRHGSAKPSRLFKRMAEVGLTATEGGPISYCLPYSRLPIREAIADWKSACNYLADGSDVSHIESFAGCMMGQLCDPAILVALNILEAKFLTQNRISSVSLSYAQGISLVQDRAALRVLREMASHYLDQTPHHLVVYVFMGLFPRSVGGYCRITKDAAAAAKHEHIERIIVKTPAESRRIPTFDENVASLDYTRHALNLDHGEIASLDESEYERIAFNAKALVENTLSLNEDVGEALALAFEKGLLDVPYCLHSDNINASRTTISNGYYYPVPSKTQSSIQFLQDLKHNQRQYDRV